MFSLEAQADEGLTFSNIQDPRNFGRLGSEFKAGRRPPRGLNQQEKPHRLDRRKKMMETNLYEFRGRGSGG